MFFKGSVYFESKLEWKYDMQRCCDNFVSRASRVGMKLETEIKQLNFSWKHENEWQVVMNVGFEVDDDAYGLTESPEMAKRFIRDLLDIYLTDDKLTPAYVEDAIVETDDGDFITVPDFYFIDCNEFNDEQDDAPAKMAWENYKRSEAFQEFINSIQNMTLNKWRKDLSKLRKDNATSTPIKIKKRNQKHLEDDMQAKTNERRKIFILDGGVG